MQEECKSTSLYINKIGRQNNAQTDALHSLKYEGVDVNWLIRILLFLDLFPLKVYLITFFLNTWIDETIISEDFWISSDGWLSLQRSFSESLKILPRIFPNQFSWKKFRKFRSTYLLLVLSRYQLNNFLFFNNSICFMIKIYYATEMYIKFCQFFLHKLLWRIL